MVLVFVQRFCICLFHHIGLIRQLVKFFCGNLLLRNIDFVIRLALLLYYVEDRVFEGLLVLVEPILTPGEVEDCQVELVPFGALLKHRNNVLIVRLLLEF